MYLLVPTAKVGLSAEVTALSRMRAFDAVILDDMSLYTQVLQPRGKFGAAARESERLLRNWTVTSLGGVWATRADTDTKLNFRTHGVTNTWRTHGVRTHGVTS